MTRQKQSNYEKMRDEAAAAFLRYDQTEMIRRFSLEQDEAHLYIVFFGRRYAIDRATGAVHRQSGEPADYNEAMTIYDLLCSAKPGCRLANEAVNVAGLSAIRGGSLSKPVDFFADAGLWFGGKSRALARACEAMGGRKIEKGDVAYALPMFPFLPVYLRFWGADEDFPASLQILADKNTLDFMHYETLMFALTHLLERLREECRAGE